MHPAQDCISAGESGKQSDGYRRKRMGEEGEMTFTEFDRGPEIPVLKPIERVVLMIEDRSRRNEGSRTVKRGVPA